jgi:hypothetical protein
MAGSLTKKYIKMLSEDDDEALMAALPQGFDPRDYHVHGDRLPLRCAMYGAPRCFFAMARARPDLAEEMCSIADGGFERCVDWLGAWPRRRRRARQLGPLGLLHPFGQRPLALGARVVDGALGRRPSLA